jgi:hypothetical protein
MQDLAGPLVISSFFSVATIKSPIVYSPIVVGAMVPKI